MSQICYEDVTEGTEISLPPQAVTLVNMMQYGAASWNVFLLHNNKEYAQARGFEDANIAACHYGALLARMVSRWMGDDGRLKKFRYQARKMGFPGDVLTLRGKVTRKYQEDGENLVDIELSAENKRYEGVVAVPGSATVALPSR